LANKDLAVAKVLSQVYKKVLEKVDKTVIPDMYGKPTKYFDGFELQLLIEQITEETAWYVIGAVRAKSKGGAK